MTAIYHLTLVGTVHRAREHVALRNLLTELRPDLITLEMSPFALAYRRQQGRRLRRRLGILLGHLADEGGRDRCALARHPEIVGIRRLLALPFEYRAASAYAREFSIPLELIDSSDISARKLRLIESELLTLENLRLLISLPPAPTSDREGIAAARAFVLGSRDPAVRLAFLARRRGEEEIGERDRQLAAEIRQRLLPDRHLVHIAGWVHLVEDPQGETLYSLLAELSPRRIILDPGEKIVP